MFVDLSFIMKAAYDAVSEWALNHGVRVLSIIVFALIADTVVRAALSRRRMFSTLDNVPRPKYKNIIGEQQRRRVSTVVKALKDTLSALIWGIAIVTALPEFGFNLAPILAGLGLAGLAVGMAAKDLLTDFIAGLFIIVEGEYNIGDKVKIAGVTGKVVAISLRRTILQGKSGAVHIVPNREIKVIKRFAGRKQMVESKEIKPNNKQT
ncbi:MAG: mechanosensitive ion channel family protein [Candidatus Pacebacteria bacterium]|jgi:small conductance mechanosensitive channel|nr:mechanosensitive ion channel family protein [Candidatus Paceibacterota bacterium]